MVHSSKRDLWIVVAVAGSLVVLIGVTIQHMMVRGNDPATWIVGGVTVAYLLILALFAWPISYEVTPDSLVVCSGLTRWRVPLAAIQEVRPTRSPLSAPAWSLDRLRIDYRKNEKLAFQLISPQDKQLFLQDLAQADKGLELQGDTLIRRSGGERTT